VPVFLSQPWLMALIPIGLAIMPINKLTILLLLVLAADLAVALLLAEDLSQYRLHTVAGELGSYPHRLRCWKLRRHEAMRLSRFAKIEELDNETLNARCAALIDRHRARQGVVTESSGGQGMPLWSNPANKRAAARL